MARVTEFEFASDTTYADKTKAVASYGTPPKLTVEACAIPLDHLAPFRTAVLELLDQPVDGVTDTVKHVDGTTIDVTFDPAARTIKATGIGTPYSEAKARDLLAGCVLVGLLAPLGP